MAVNSALIRPCFLGGGWIGGVPLDSHVIVWAYVVDFETPRC